MHRVSEVIDCWYDSGSMPFAQWHYPFENKETFENRFPADFISEAIDQTRGWFYTLMAIGTAIFGQSPFKNCIVMGHVQDENGRKMRQAHRKRGRTRGRCWINRARMRFVGIFTPPVRRGLPSRFSDKAVNEGQRKFMATLQNTYAFFVLYANIDQFDPKEHDISNVKLMLMGQVDFEPFEPAGKTGG